MTRLLPFSLLLLCGCGYLHPGSSAGPFGQAIVSTNEVASIMPTMPVEQPVSVRAMAIPLVSIQPVQTTITVGWNCADSTEHPLGSYFTGLERTASLPPQWEVVASFPAQASNQCAVVSYTPQAYFRAWTGETNRF